MIHVIAIIVTKPGLRAQVLDLFTANCPAVLAESGCVEYQATVDAAKMQPSKGTLGADTFVVVEKWETLEALQAHAASPHMVAYGAKTKEMLASRTIHVLEPAAQGV